MDGPSPLKKAQDLSARSFSSSDRRRYFEHLLTLPSYKIQSINAYYAKCIARNFGEFEDLQDQAVDAVLDLCEDEDEQTRICGIQALAEIGKVEPRWVRGNTGVLLQLLECPPSELRHVKQALSDLLEVSPSEVFSIMAEDCKGSEAETGASRRNILEFLNTDAKSQRKELLESGKYIEAENTFSSGFYDVLSTTAIAETRLILSLLLPLSTISGRNCTRASSGKFAKTLIKCLHPKSSIGLTMLLIKLWDDFTTKADGLDPRWMICFLADHGEAVVQAALEKGDKEAKSILEYPNTNTSKRLGRYFARDNDRSEPELETRKLIPVFAQTMLDPVLRYSTRSKIEPKDIYTLELVMYGVYTVLTLDRHMRDHIPKPLSRQLVEFGKLANRNKRNAEDDTTEESWRNLRDMAEIMSDRNERAITIQPSWTIETKLKAKSKSRSPVKSARRVSPGPSNTSSSSALKAITPNAPGVRSQVTEPLSKLATATDSPAIPPPSVRVQETVPPTRPVAPVPSSLAAVPIIVPTIPLPVPTSAPIAPTPGPSGLSIRSRADHLPTPTPPKPTKAAAAPAAVTTEVAPASLKILARARQAPIDILASAPATTQGLSIRATSKPAETPIPKPQGMSIRAFSKPAEPPRPTPTAPPSLLSRMTSSTTNIRRPIDDLTTQKHLSNDTQTQFGVQSMMQKPPVPSQPPPMEKRLNNATVPTSSLLSRMTPRGVPTSAPSPGQVTTLPTAVFSIKRSGSNLPPRPASGTAPSPTSSGFSIKNRSISSSSLNTSTASSTGTTSTGSGLSIKRKGADESLPPTPAKPVGDDAPIIRKGRGFAPGAGAGYTNEVLITPPPIVHRPTSSSFNLADRLGIKKGRFA